MDEVVPESRLSDADHPSAAAANVTVTPGGGAGHGTVRVGRLPVLFFGLGFAWAVAGSFRLLTSTPYVVLATEGGGDAAPAVGQVAVSLATANGAWVVGLLTLVTITFGGGIVTGPAHGPVKGRRKRFAPRAGEEGGSTW